MSTTAQASSRGARQVTLDGAGVALSALLREPAGAPPRAVVVALHGAGMNASYFDGAAHPDLSLLTLGADLGFTVLAVDRPGYGRSADLLPEGQTLRQQARSLRAALSDFGSRQPTGAGFFLLAHSFGGKLALACAAYDAPQDLIGIDISGCGHRYAVPSESLAGALDDRRLAKSWGRLGLYPPNTFRSSAAAIAPTPVLERSAARRWPADFTDLAPRVSVPVRFTFAEHESWWRHDERTIADLTSWFTAAPRVRVDRQPNAGHNISLGWAARSYHLRALGFLEECLGLPGARDESTGGTSC